MAKRCPIVGVHVHIESTQPKKFLSRYGTVVAKSKKPGHVIVKMWETPFSPRAWEVACSRLTRSKTGKKYVDPRELEYDPAIVQPLSGSRRRRRRR